MKNDLNTHLPILLLIDDENSIEFRKVSGWLPGTDLTIYDASNVLDAVEEMSDFTVRDCPDVILLKVGSFSKEYSAIVRFLHCAPVNADDPRVLTFSDNKSYPHSVNNLTEFKTELQKMRNTGGPVATAQSV